MADKSYIGDGVYASYDGSFIWLETTRDNGVERIALEPAVFSELVSFARSVWPLAPICVVCGRVHKEKAK